MSQSIDQSRRQLLALTGKAGLTTLTAQAIGVNLGLVGVARKPPRSRRSTLPSSPTRTSTAARTMSSTNSSKMR